MSRLFRCSQNFNFLSRFYRQGKLQQQQQQQQYKKIFLLLNQRKSSEPEVKWVFFLYIFILFLNAYLLWVRLMAS